MTLDRPHARQAFAEYTSHYNAADPKVKLKIDHTYRVAALCERIANSLSLPPQDVDLAWLCGLLHDVGRFEQLRRYGTFIDAKSIDHALMSVTVLFEEDRLRDYIAGTGEDALLRTAHHYFEEYCKMSGRISGETMQSVLEIEDPGQLADIIAANVLSKIEDRQQVLEEFDELARLESVCALLVRETELAGVEKKVQARVRKQIEQNQKDYFLREQIKAIQTEVGDKDATDVEDLRERLAKTPMNDEARDKANRELERLSRMAPGSPEIGVSRTYIEWLLDLPWGKTTPDNLDLKRARRILAEDHYGQRRERGTAV